MPDKQNGFNIQSEADAMLWRQQQEVLPGKGKLRLVSACSLVVEGLLINCLQLSYLLCCLYCHRVTETDN